MPKSIRALPLRTFDTELRDLLDRQAAAIEVFRPEFLAGISDPELLTEIRGMGRELAIYVKRKAKDGSCQSRLPQVISLDQLAFSVQLHLYCIALLCRRAKHATRSAR